MKVRRRNDEHSDLVCIYIFIGLKFGVIAMLTQSAMYHTCPRPSSRMPLTLQVYHSPSSFIRGLEVAVSNSPFYVDTAHMNIILGAAYDARGRDERSVWMVITRADCSMGEDSEAYTLPSIAQPSQESEALRSPIL
jgi:hypothetical protein